MDTDPLNRAIHLAGGVNALARQLGRTHQAVCGWRKTGIPPQAAIDIEIWSAGKIRAIDCIRGRA